MAPRRRINKNAPPVWVDRVRAFDPLKGKTVRHEISAPTKRELEELRDQIKQRERQRKRGLAVAREHITYDDLADKFLAQYQHTERSKRTLIDRLRYSRAAFGPTYVRDLVPDQLAAWNTGLTVGPTTKGNALRAMRQILRFGVECGFLEKNPAAIKAPRPARRRIKPFESWEEVEAVAAAAGRYGPLIRFACATGLRPQEWMALEWQTIDFNRKELRVEQTVRSGKIEQAAKTEGSLRTVRLVAAALDALRSLDRPIAGGLIFPAPEGGLVHLSNHRKRVWRPALRAAGVEYRALDNTRHTYATLAIAAGIPVEYVSKQLGHKSLETTLRHYKRWLPVEDDRYTELFDAFTAQASQSGRKRDGEVATDADA
jgi:integrase